VTGAITSTAGGFVDGPWTDDSGPETLPALACADATTGLTSEAKSPALIASANERRDVLSMSKMPSPTPSR